MHDANNFHAIPVLQEQGKHTHTPHTFTFQKKQTFFQFCCFIFFWTFFVLCSTIIVLLQCLLGHIQRHILLATQYTHTHTMTRARLVTKRTISCRAMEAPVNTPSYVEIHKRARHFNIPCVEDSIRNSVKIKIILFGLIAVYYYLFEFFFCFSLSIIFFFSAYFMWSCCLLRVERKVRARQQISSLLALCTY